jgi:hypothetical protein
MADEKKISSSRRDTFRALRPKTTNVAVGNHTLELTTANLDQESVFLKTVSDLNLGELVGPLTEIMQAADGTETTSFMDKVRSAGPDLWGAARVVLGVQFIPAVRTAATAMLNTNKNHEILAQAYPEAADDVQTGTHGEFLGSGLISSVVGESLTLRQAVEIIRQSWTMNGYGELLGNVLAPEAPAKE